MTGTVGSHPRGDGLPSAIFHGLRQVLSISGRMIELHSSQFHVVHPVVLLVDVGRLDRGGLADTRLTHTCFIGGCGLCANLCSKVGIEGFQHTGTQGKAGGELARCTGHTGRSIEELPALLWLSAAEIDWSSQTRTIAIIHGITGG